MSICMSQESTCKTKWYRDSEEYWQYITGCVGDADCSVRVQKVASTRDIVEAILRNRISVDICQQEVDDGGVFNLCHMPAGIVEASFVVTGDVSPRDVRITGPDGAQDGARATLQNGRWAVKAPRSGKWRVFVTLPDERSVRPRVEVVYKPADFNISFTKGPPFFVGRDIPMNIDLDGANSASLEKAEFLLQRVHEGRDQESLKVRLRRAPSGLNTYEVVSLVDDRPPTLADRMGSWTFRFTTQVATAEGFTRTFRYGEAQAEFVEVPSISELGLAITKVKDENWNRAQIRLLITNPTAHALVVLPDVTAQGGKLEDIQGRPSITKPKPMEIGPNGGQGELVGLVRCLPNRTAQIVGLVTMQSAGGQPIVGHAEISELIKCVSISELGLAITKVKDENWNRAQIRLLITNPTAHALVVLPDVTAQGGKLEDIQGRPSITKPKTNGDWTEWWSRGIGWLGAMFA